MKLRKKLGFLILITSVFFVSVFAHYIWDIGTEQQVLNVRVEEKSHIQYKLVGEFDAQSKTVKGKQTVVYTNRQDAALKSIYFHLYPNTFKTEGTAPFAKEEMSLAYPNGFSPGWIEIKDVARGREKVDYKVMGEASTLLRITPKYPIATGEKIELAIEFELHLPNSIGRMGYGENTVNITNWYPIAAVYDENGWNLDPYYAIGDPFYSEVGSYEVDFTVPREYTLATTGDIVKATEKKEKKAYRIEAQLVRDFAIILSKDFQIERGIVEGTEVKSYSIQGQKGKEALQYGLDAIQIFNGVFGKYPYKQISVVASDFFIGGMEYPNLVMISQDLYELEQDFPLEYVVVHEIAHQWWYGIVGNNQVKESWLDEALTEYSTLLYFEQKYGPHIKEQVFEKMIKAQYENYKDLKPKGREEILRGLDEFNSSLEYSSLVYSKGAMFIEALQGEMGKEAFLKALREYYSLYQFKNATTEAFLEICQKHSKKDIRELFEAWL